MVLGGGGMLLLGAAWGGAEEGSTEESFGAVLQQASRGEGNWTAVAGWCGTWPRPLDRIYGVR